MTTRDYRGTTALITGASAGLGVEYATQLAARGADVVLVARREDRLRELADRLTRDHGVRATPIALDLTRTDAAALLRRELDERGLRVQSLVNNAGFGMKGAFAEADAARVGEMVQVNVAALVAITRELLPEMVADGRGVLVGIASTAAYQPCPSMAVYGATKAFVLSFTEALAFETKGSGLGVLAVSPGATRTEFFDITGGDAAVGRFQTPAQVVQLTLRRLDRDDVPPSVVSGRANAFSAWAARVMPRRLTLAVSGRVLG
ncbi:SDR family NAD(P)-dependent oxidoreductase [Microbacterium allomyrinae]|uniref:NADP-dependent 3-hydroxy acid dehydrogenase YdfG n=1 Tax=Microbacterium allomyrinae TaxID=2830666 RepID=A0A9X1S2T7_9MICO|nr:SDR family oxidoreductase [Microbacterium allomyrinae]MCC2031767.1 SDR family oxidoreductase [Microbacterium allomyrinae]